MRRRKLAAKILAVIMAVSACVSVNDSALIAMAAENTETEAVSAAEESTDEGSGDVDADSDDTAVVDDDGEDSDDAITGEGTGAAGTEDADTSGTYDNAGAAVTEGSGDTETEVEDPADPTAFDDGQTAEEAAAVDEEQADDEELNPADEESSQEAATADAEKAAEEQLPGMMEIIYSEGITDESGRKMAGSGASDAEDILNAEVIEADVNTPSAGCVLAGVAGQYFADQQAALDRINEIRREACQEGVPNPDTGLPLTMDDYVPIKWSGDLEYIARIRAAESAFTRGHARMNGQSGTDIFNLTSPSGVRSWGEVLAWNGTESMYRGIDQWYGEKADWVNQTSGAVTGHYTQMIDPTNRYVGLGTFCSHDAPVYNTTAGEFSYESGLSEYYMNMTGYCVQLLDVAIDHLSSGGQILGKLYGAKGSTGRLLLSTGANFKITSPVYFLDGVDWSSSNTAVVTVAGDGTTTAVGSGTSTIQASAAGGAVTATAQFSVKSIEDCNITLAQTSYTYDGNAKEPAVTVRYHGSLLLPHKDYNVSYDNNVDAGTATVTITGSEEYAGTVRKQFTILKASQSPSAEDVSVEYGASAQIKVAGAQGTLTYESQNTDIAAVSDNGTVTGVKTGTTTIEVKADGGNNYEPASITVNCVVMPVSLSDARIEISLSETEFTYNSIEQKPDVKVLFNGEELAVDTDYELVWGESTNAGEKSVSIKGVGNYSGKVTKTYVIRKAAQSISAHDVTVEYRAFKQAVIDDAHGDVHFRSRDTSVATVDEIGNVAGVAAGMTVVDVTADGNENFEEGTASFYVSVTPIRIDDPSRVTVNLSQDTFIYNGQEQKPVVTVVCDGKELIAGTDYELLFGANILADGDANADGITKAGDSTDAGNDTIINDYTNAGEKMFVVKAVGNYNGSVYRRYTILKAAQELSAQDVRVAIDSTAAISVEGAHTALSFESRDPSVATVDADGTVTGVNFGETTISILAEENENYKAEQTQVHVTVCKLEQDLVGSASSLGIDAGKNGVFTVTGAVGEVSATVGNTGIANVSSVTPVEGEEGTYKIVVSGVSVGSTKLTVTASGDNGHEAAVVTCSCKIRPRATTSFKAAAAANGKGIKLTWAKVAGATSYVIYRNGKAIKTVGNVATWTDAGANTNGTKYTFKIYAKAATGVSSQFKSVVYYKLNRPATPTATNSASKKMTVKWAKNAKATGYQIQYSLKSNYSGARSKSVSKNSIVSYTIGNLTKGKTYYVRVRALKKVSGKVYYSAWSASRKVKISK